LRDKSKKRQYKNDTFFAASAVKRSYVSGTNRFPGDQYIPKEGGIVIEAGAYVGYKAVSFGQQVGSTGKVIAIEASIENFELLQKNIVGNGLNRIVTPLHCAVWKQDGAMEMMSKTRMKNTIVDTEELTFKSNAVVQTKSIDTIIDEFNLKYVDFLNLQLNGAEIICERLERIETRQTLSVMPTAARDPVDVAIDICSKFSL
jgi:FkbM family methyltransferase